MLCLVFILSSFSVIAYAGFASCRHAVRLLIEDLMEIVTTTSLQEQKTTIGISTI